MCGMRLILFGLLFGISNPTFSKDTEPLTTQQLIDQLGHQQFSQREKAYKLLQSRGPIILPWLRKALTHPDEEVRTQAEKLIPILEIPALGPKRVTLKVEQEPLANILQQIEKQTGYKVEANSKGEKRYSLQMNEVTFWEAIEQIRKETGETISFSLKGSFFEPRWIETRCRQVSNHGIFRMEANAIQEVRYLNYDDLSSNDPQELSNHRMTFMFGIFVEPRFQVITLGKVVLNRAWDDQGHSLSLASLSEKEQNARIDYRNYLQNKQHNRIYEFPNFEMTLQSSSKRGEKIKQLKGKIPVTVAFKSKEVVVAENVLQSMGTKFQSGIDTLAVTEVSQENDGSIFVQIGHIPPEQPCYKYRWHDRFHLVTSSGTRLQTRSRGLGLENKKDFRIGLKFSISEFAGNLLPMQLGFEDWIMVECEIPFEFKDLLLP
jgi:hypothetical protein